MDKCWEQAKCQGSLQNGKWCVHFRNEWKNTRSQHNFTRWSIITRYRLVSWQQLMSSLSSSCSEIIILLGCTNLQAMTSPPSPPYKASLSSPVKKKKENNTKREETENKGMRWYCEAQLFTSHQARRSQRHNMSQHAKRCKLEHTRFPETEQRNKL